MSSRMFFKYYLLMSREVGASQSGFTFRFPFILSLVRLPRYENYHLRQMFESIGWPRLHFRFPSVHFWSRQASAF